MPLNQPGTGLAILAKPLVNSIVIGIISLRVFPSWTSLFLAYLLLLIGLGIFMTVRTLGQKTKTLLTCVDPPHPDGQTSR